MDALRTLNGKTNNNQPVFMKSDEMPVTSSPIEGKLIENPSFNNQITDKFSTWADLLGGFHHTEPKKKWKLQPDNTSGEPSTSCQDSSNTSYLEPIVKHKMRVVVTPNRKIQVVSSSRQKIGEHQKMKSYSKLSKAYRHHFQDTDDSNENIETIKEKLRSKEKLNVEDVERYEQILRNFISQQAEKKDNLEAKEILNSDVMNFIEKTAGEMILSPNTIRILKMKQQQQEKRLVSLAVAKRKSAAEIKRRISGQQALVRCQIAEHENQEMKQIKASLLRKDAVLKSTLFNKVHSVHWKKLADQTRQKNYTQQLDRQFQKEKMENNNQANKIVREVWDTLLRQQYGELRKEICLQNKMQRQIVDQSGDQLKRFKDSYEEKLRELKKAAEAKAAESGVMKKDVQAEIERIKRNLRKQFDVEFQNLLQKVQHKGDHQRFLRDERGKALRERIQRADFVFDI